MASASTLLNQPEFIHTALNHFPLTGLVVAWLALLLALVSRNRGAMLIGLALVGVFSLSVWPVAYFGDAGYDRVLSMSDEDGQAFLRYHEALADRWMFLYYITAGVSALGFGLAWKWPKWLSLFAAVALLTAAASLAAGLAIAHAGGQIRHREFRRGPPPTGQEEHA